MADNQRELEQKCQKTIEHFKGDLSRLRTGRAQASLIETLTVDYYGSAVPIRQLGLISVPESRQLAVQVYDRGAVESVEKAIRQADLGLNPMSEGTLIRINIPTLTEERRKELVKKIHKMAEETKIALRNHRRDSLEVLKKREKDKELAQDDSRKEQERIQKVIDASSAQVDSLLSAKEKELLEV